MFCTNCGHRNPPGASFCSSCGVLLVAEDPAATTAIAIDPADTATTEHVVAEELREITSVGTAVVVVRSGPDTGAGFVLDAKVTRVGRHPESEIFLDDITVSRRHAEFRRRAGGYTLRDVGSLNGTYVNRERIEEAELHHRDEVQIGKFKLVFLSSASN